MLKKTLNLILSATLLTAITFASLGCNQKWDNQKNTEFLDSQSQITLLQESTCDCLISNQTTEIHQPTSDFTDVKVITLNSKIFPQKDRETTLNVEETYRKESHHDPPPHKWIKTLARSQLHS